MKFLEKDLEQIIWETDNKILREKGLPIFGKMLRQQRIGNYGIADLITIETSHDLCESRFHITIYELKKDKISMSAFLQAVGYTKGISQYLNSVRKLPYDYELKIVLIGSEIDTNSEFAYLPDFIGVTNDYIDNKLTYYTYDFDVNGIKFTEHSGYVLTNSGFGEEVDNG